MVKWGHLSKLDPESLRGKLLLILVEKLFLTALVGLAIVGYDQLKDREAQDFQQSMVLFASRLEEQRSKEIAKFANTLQDERLTTQRSLDRLNLLRELAPTLRNKDEDPLARAILLRSAVKTDLIDAVDAV